MEFVKDNRNLDDKNNIVFPDGLPQDSKEVKYSVWSPT